MDFEISKNIEKLIIAAAAKAADAANAAAKAADAANVAAKAADAANTAAKATKNPKFNIIDAIPNDFKNIKKINFKMIPSTDGPTKGRGRGSPPIYWIYIGDKWIVIKTLAFFKFSQYSSNYLKKKNIKLTHLRNLIIQLEEYIIKFSPNDNKSKKDLSQNLPILIDDKCMSIILANEVAFKIIIYSKISSSVVVRIERNLQSYLYYDPSILMEVDDSKYKTELSKRKIKESYKKRQEMTIKYHKEKKQRLKKKTRRRQNRY
jgi:hypothetical protein